MKLHLIKALLKAASWLGWQPPRVPPLHRACFAASPYLISARIVVLKWEKNDPGSGGTYKRHKAYEDLLKRYPKARKRDLALAIELAVQEVL